MRKLITAVSASALAIALGVVGADTGAAIYAEYQLARHVRSAADLRFDPWVAILGFPFVPQALRERYSELEIKAGGVQHPVVGKVTLETTMHDIDLSQASWLMRPGADLPVGKLESDAEIPVGGQEVVGRRRVGEGGDGEAGGVMAHEDGDGELDE